MTGIEAAVAMHPGPASEPDSRVLPGRFRPAGDYRTEICWPVFLTGSTG
ncbi:MAG TPA: hypothetical protein VMI73_09545 [Trebonia sp.]|nr:hypothetical protein [Trebonia sp.]